MAAEERPVVGERGEVTVVHGGALDSGSYGLGSLVWVL